MRERAKPGEHQNPGTCQRTRRCHCFSLFLISHPHHSQVGSLHRGLSVCPAVRASLREATGSLWNQAIWGKGARRGLQELGCRQSSLRRGPGRAHGGRVRALLHVAHHTGRLKGKCQLRDSHPRLLAAARLWGGQVCVFGGRGSPYMCRGPTIRSRGTGSNPQIFQA